MATDDSRAGAARRRTFQEIAADGMELPLVKARTESGRDWLTGTFTLLRATGIHVRWKDAKTGEYRGYIRGLVDALDYDRDGKCWSVRLDPEIVALFAPDEHTWVHLDTRLQLGKSYLAKWLHGYFSSHRKPLPVSVARLQSLSGSQGEVRFFRRRLRQAMDEVAFAERSRRAHFEWHVDAADLVHVRRDSGH